MIPGEIPLLPPHTWRRLWRRTKRTTTTPSGTQRSGREGPEFRRHNGTKQYSAQFFFLRIWPLNSLLMLKTTDVTTIDGVH